MLQCSQPLIGCTILLFQDNSQGQLGSATASEQRSPTLVLGGRAFAAIAAGMWHTCALSANGSAFCWGYSPANGQGSNTNEPAEVTGSQEFTALGAGWNHTVGLDTNGNIWSWGEASGTAEMWMENCACH